MVRKMIKQMFVHVAAQFCHPSLGTKIHLNVQNVNQPIHMPATEKFFGATTLKELTADNSTHLMVCLLYTSDAADE